MIEEGLSLGCKDGSTCKLISVMHHINRVNDKNYMIDQSRGNRKAISYMTPFIGHCGKGRLIESVIMSMDIREDLGMS